jgi:hypothetical protein
MNNYEYLSGVQGRNQTADTKIFKFVLNTGKRKPDTLLVSQEWMARQSVQLIGKLLFGDRSTVAGRLGLGIG